MIRPAILVSIAMVVVMASCGNDSDDVYTANTDASPTATSTLQATTSTTASPQVIASTLPELFVWPLLSTPAEWPRTPDEAAAAFVEYVAMGEKAATPRPAVQTGTTATAELPLRRWDGVHEGLASTIYMQAAQLDDGTTTWVVVRAQSKNVVVDYPPAGELLIKGTTIRGQGQNFEGSISFQVFDRGGVLGTALAVGGALGENMPFKTQMQFDRCPVSEGKGVLASILYPQVEDVSLQDLTMLPVRLPENC
ncbi:hypothetical protein [Candidatus Poriferisocius sp.]|uniref:hypothetical protein n=1 Tax=Candidatus Poriferisocius sp. TaxID=3101276 RepID=UPI003B01718B